MQFLNKLALNQRFLSNFEELTDPFLFNHGYLKDFEVLLIIKTLNLIILGEKIKSIH